jgi:hypothetical protein
MKVSGDVVGVGDARKRDGESGSTILLTYTRNPMIPTKKSNLSGLERRFGWRIFHRLPLISMRLYYHLRFLSVKKPLFTNLT